MAVNPDILQQIVAKKQKFIDKSILSAQSDIATLQSELLNSILSDYVTQFDTKNGVITNSANNYRLLSGLDKVFDNFYNDFSLPFAKIIGNQLLDLKSYNIDYYNYLTNDKANIQNISKSLDILKARIGFDGKNIIPNSYLDNIATSPEVKVDLANYMVSAISNQTSLKELSKGFNELIKGTPDTSGLLERYHNQYTFDTYNKVDNMMNKIMGDSLNLNYFLYAGTVIKSTRPFCRSRAGKVFTKAEGESFNSLDFQGKTDPYNFFVDAGGFNCRHSILFITKEIYDSMKNN